MSCILYYSNFCEHSKKLLQQFSKTSLSKDIHFVCVDNRKKNENGKWVAIVANNQEIVVPETVTRVPALLLLSNYQVLFGTAIVQYFQPQEKQILQESTENNMEPSAFFTFGSGVMSDRFSFIEENGEKLSPETRQIQNSNYVKLTDNVAINASEMTPGTSQKIPEDKTNNYLKQYNEQREKDDAQFKKPF
jgi:hypothetical protein